MSMKNINILRAIDEIATDNLEYGYKTVVAVKSEA